MTVRILNHTLEIISLLTGEDSLLQHLTNSRIKIELKKNRKTCQRILNHALEIISVLTGEEYTIVKKKSPQSDIHQRAGECKDAAVSLSMEVWEQTEEHKDHLNSLGIPSHMSPGLRGDDLNTVSINEDGEYERDEKDILQVTIHSDTCAGVKCVVVPKLEQEEESAGKRLQPVKEEEISVNISEVPSNLKPPIFSKSDQGKEMGVISYQEVKQESVNEDSCMNRNSEQHHSSHRSIQLGIGAIEVTEMYQEAIANRSPYRSKPVPDLDKELNSHVDINPTELGLATDKDYTSKQEATIYLNKKGKESTKEMENLENLLEVENSCEYSENSPSYNSELHIQQSILTTGKPFACSECGKSFRYKSKLVQHESVHTVEKPFTCAECGKCFKYKSNLVQHESVHTGVKPFACSECGKCFSQASYLVTHERTHTGEKSFECSECGKWFSRKSNLVHHEKTHTGDKPFTCSECGKCFRYKSNLVQHETVHTGVKPFSCSECGKYFRYKSELAHHESVHTCA